MDGKKRLNRRKFLQSAGAAGVGLALAPGMLAQARGQGGGDDLKIAMIGPGSQGRNLLMTCLKIPGVRFTAICDIWNYHQRYAANILRKFKQPVNVYVDYREMLEQETDLDAVIIATPDFVHDEQTVACLQAGKHVYCEKEMSHTLEGARRMVQAARKTGKLLQVGHQRRSNPRYWHAKDMIYKEGMLGTITHVQGQWNRSRRQESGWPKGQEVPADRLARFGYENMNQFRNWRWFKKFSGGPMADLGSHQIDVFNWFLKAVPEAVLASGGQDWYDQGQWYDNVLSIYEYPGAEGGRIRGFYQVLNTTSYGGFYEVFMGDEGSLVISEDSRKGYVYREVQARKKDWEDEAHRVEGMDTEAIQLKVGESLLPDGTKDPKAERLAAEANKPVHQLHLENFFDAIRGKAELTCPPEVAYETAVAVLTANQAVEAGRKIALESGEFTL
ncbi:MAG: Gfo/Idh/MocA family protein [Planctomycetota bacterium]